MKQKSTWMAMLMLSGLLLIQFKLSGQSIRTELKPSDQPMTAAESDRTRGTSGGKQRDGGDERWGDDQSMTRSGTDGNEPLTASPNSGLNQNEIHFDTRSKTEILADIAIGKKLTAWDLLFVDPGTQVEIIDGLDRFQIPKFQITETELKKLPMTLQLFAKAHPDLYEIQ